jgi:integrase
MRLAELQALTREDVDLESGTVWVRNKPGRPTK